MFQNGNDSKNTVKLTQKWFNDNEHNFLEYLSQFPAPNAIDHIMDVLKKADIGPLWGLDELWTNVREACSGVIQTTLKIQFTPFSDV